MPSGKEYHKKYYQDHKEKRQEYDKNYREENADKIKEYRSQKITCECGKEVSRHHFARHLRSDSHKKSVQAPP